MTSDGVYFSVAFEIIDEEAKAELEKRGGKVLQNDTEPQPPTEPRTAQESDDVD